MLKSFIPLITTTDPITKYAEIAATIPVGQKYVQEFDYATQENPAATEAHYLEELYPNATVLGADGDVGSWEISQYSLGACGTFANIAAYASSSGEYHLENGIYPLEVSSIGLYFVRIQDPTNPLETVWMAIDSKVPCKPGGKSNFIGVTDTLAPALLMKAAATARGGCFDEITNHAALKRSFNWFPSVPVNYSIFESYSAAIERGGISVFAMADQYDAAGNKITPAGVVYGHAFAGVDTLTTTNADGSPVQLVRVENPWGGGSDYISDYSENAPFWDEHPELASYRSDAQQSGGNYWVSWNQLKQLAGRTEFSVQTPLPLPEYPAPSKVITATFDESTAISPPWTANLIALATQKNNQVILDVTETTTFLFSAKWLNGSGDRHHLIKFANASTNAFVVQTGTTYWAGVGSQKLTLQPGKYKMLPCTQDMLLDRGELQILIMANKPFNV